MKRTWFRLTVAFIPAVFGIFLPVFTYGSTPDFINVFWGFVFGFGWYLLGYFASLSSPPAVLFGSLLWPMAVCSLLFLWSGCLLRLESTTKIVVFGVLIFSLLFNVPQRLTSMSPLRYVPLYPNILGAVY